MLDDADLKKGDLADILDVLMDTHESSEGPLTIAQIQRRLATHPRIEKHLSQERIKRTLSWGLHQPNTIDHPGRIVQVSRTTWQALLRWEGK